MNWFRIESKHTHSNTQHMSITIENDTIANVVLKIIKERDIYDSVVQYWYDIFPLQAFFEADGNHVMVEGRMYKSCRKRSWRYDCLYNRYGCKPHIYSQKMHEINGIAKAVVANVAHKCVPRHRSSHRSTL